MLDELWIEGTISDAFDCDFCDGEFHAMRFKDIGVTGLMFQDRIL